MSKVKGSLNATISGKTPGVVCNWCITDQVCLWQNGFFWHPWAVWKYLEACLSLRAFRACPGCKS